MLLSPALTGEIMSPDSTLYDLVHSLSKGEKRNLQMAFNSGQEGQSQNQVLFDLIKEQSSDTQDIERIVEKKFLEMFPKMKQFSVVKNYLYNSILAFLARHENYQAFPPIVAEVRVLLEKGLVKAASKRIDRNIKDCQEREDFNSHLELLNLLMKVSRDTQISHIIVKREAVEREVNRIKQLRCEFEDVFLGFKKEPVSVPETQGERSIELLSQTARLMQLRIQIAKFFKGFDRVVLDGEDQKAVKNILRLHSFQGFDGFELLANLFVAIDESQRVFLSDIIKDFRKDKDVRLLLNVSPSAAGALQYVDFASAELNEDQVDNMESELPKEIADPLQMQVMFKILKYRSRNKTVKASRILRKYSEESFSRPVKESIFYYGSELLQLLYSDEVTVGSKLKNFRRKVDESSLFPRRLLEGISTFINQRDKKSFGLLMDLVGNSPQQEVQKFLKITAWDIKPDLGVLYSTLTGEDWLES